MKPAPEADNDALRLSRSFAETVDRRAEFLTAYQNASYARTYGNWVEKYVRWKPKRLPVNAG